MVRVEVRVRGRRRKPVAIGGAQDVHALLRREARQSDREKFWVLHLDARNHLLSFELTSIGTATASLVHPRETWRAALVVGAVAVIVAHNHPSGDPRPSPEDKATTRRLVEAGKVLGVPLLDHVILASNGKEKYFSFREHGLME